MNGFDPQTAIYIASPIVIGVALLLVVISGRLGVRARQIIVLTARVALVLLLLCEAAVCAIQQRWWLAAVFAGLVACLAYPWLAHLGRSAAQRLRGARG